LLPASVFHACPAVDTSRASGGIVPCVTLLYCISLGIINNQNGRKHFITMKKIYHLGKCTTCQAIIKEMDIDKKGFQMQEIRTEKITPAQLDEMKKMAGSYEALFNRRAIKYKELGLKYKKLEEKDCRNFILQEDTFLKRPVVIIHDKIFIGSEKKNVEVLKKAVK
jgi:arsenate reductase (glutaredoxin)